MVGLMQIMIYLFCVYLIYKGVEIFQIAFVSVENRTRQIGIFIGGIAIIAAIGIAGIALKMADDLSEKIGNNMPRYP